ncbi:phage tail tape measure protein [Pseudomonas sp. TNT2022 ID233]|uniref:phage tail tape measure protein n=1 Tax=Pseudomonas aphyarum TaxID=2942629 RepID=UPI002360FC08|nr:phage tail tape measure protein [Pseudomonas aphyarum]MDD1138766.1 phage tail tape measure protein [Pseudomonas aphyarum]
MADGSYSLTFTEVDQQAQALNTASKMASLMSPASSMQGADSASANIVSDLSLSGAFAGLGLALADSTAELRRLTSEQVQLRDVLSTIHGVLVSQRSLQQAMNDRQAQPGPVAGMGAGVPSANPEKDALKDLRPAISFDTAMAKLETVVGFKGDERRTFGIALEQMATESKVAAGGSTMLDLAGVGYAAVKAGVGNDHVNDEGELDNGARQKDVLEFTRDTGVTATAFGMKAADTADLLIGWRTSMSLNRAQTLDLADATSLLGSRLSASEADIGSILSNYGASAKGAGMTPEQAAAFSAALLNAGVNRADAGVAFEKITTTLAQGDKAPPAQRAALSELKLDPKALAEQMKGDAPGAILNVLEALKTQSPDRQSELAMTLFSVDQPVIKMLQNTGDVKRSFDLVADKKQYASSELGEKASAVNETARIQSQTSQAHINGFNAQKDRLYTSAGDTVLPSFNAVADTAAKVAGGLSGLAEQYPTLTAALVLSIAGIRSIAPLGKMYAGAAGWVKDTVGTLQGAYGKAVSVAGSIRTGAGTLATRTEPLRAAATNRIGYMRSAAGRSMISRGARFGRIAGPLSMPLTMVEAGLKVVEGVAENDTKKVAGGVGMAAGGLAGGYAGASIGATIGTFILPGVGTLIGGALGGAIGSFYGSQEGEALGEKLATPAPDKLAPPAEVSAGLSSVQAQNQSSANVTYAPAFHFSGGDLASVEKVSAMVAQVMQTHFTSDFTPLMSTNPLGTRRDAALTDGVAT